jgi:small-conductance mechanosensitive channel
VVTQGPFETSVGVDANNFITTTLQASGRLLILGLGVLITWRTIKRQLQHIDDRRRRDQLSYFLPRVLSIPTLFFALSAAKIDVSAMAATMATVGLTGAVVFTPLGQNLVAGAMIRIDDIYRSGEIVSVAGLSGRVMYRTMLRTELALADGSTAYVPNSAFQENNVLNHSRDGAWRMCVEVPLDCSADRDRGKQLMEAVITQRRWSSSPEQPFVAFDRVGTEATFFNVYVWITDRTQEPYYRGQLLDELVDVLESRGVSVGQTTNLSIAPSPSEPSPSGAFTAALS